MPLSRRGEAAGDALVGQELQLVVGDEYGGDTHLLVDAPSRLPLLLQYLKDCLVVLWGGDAVLGVGVDDPAIPVQHEDGPFCPRALILCDSVEADHFSCCVAQHWEWDAPQHLRELPVRFQAVGADGDDLRAQLLDFLVVLLKGGKLLRSTAGVVLGVEGDHQLTLTRVVGRPLSAARRAGQCEVGSLAAFGQTVCHLGTPLQPRVAVDAS